MKRKNAPPPADYTARLFARNRAERELLAGRHLVVVGAGSVGSAVALMAARAGVGSLDIIDHETLAPENLGRHVCDLTMLGWPKAAAVAECVRRVNPQARVRARYADFRTLGAAAFAGCPDGRTALVGATDSFAAHSLLNLISLRRRVPAVFIGCWGPARAGEVFCSLPGETACFECYAGFRRDREPLAPGDPRRYTDPDFDESRAPSEAGLWPNVLFISSFACQVVLAVLGCAPQQALLADAARRPLWLVNVTDTSSPLPPFAVAPARVARGCAVCQPERADSLELDAPGREVPEAPRAPEAKRGAAQSKHASDESVRGGAKR
jgi:hypothetical protein